MGLKEYLLGFNGESKACKYLLKDGFEVLQRNFRSKFGEIDIIAKKDGIIHFIEVKTTQGDYQAQYRLTKSKLNKILKTIDYYMILYGFKENFQVDLVIINSQEIKIIDNITI